MPFMEPRHLNITYRCKDKSAASRGKQSGYIVQFGGKTIGGFHETYHDALHALREARGLASIKQLPLKTKFRKAAAIKGKRVPYLVLRKKGWSCPKVPLGKTFATAKAAIQAVKKSKKGQRFLASAVKKMRPVKTGPLPPRKLAHRIRCLARFTLKDPKRKWLPADASASVDHRDLSSEMYHCDPALHFVSLLLKFRPWKDELLNAWRQLAAWPSAEARVQSSKPTPATQVGYKQLLVQAEARGRALQKLLILTARSVSKRPVKPEWGTNANRHGSHYRGPVTTMH
jgi:hypothetical protein